MSKNNSLSTLLPDLIRVYNNTLDGFQKLNQAITTNQEAINFDSYNDDGSVSSIQIPSFGYLKNAISRLDTTLNTLTGLNDGSSSIVLPDGSFRKIILSKLPTEANDIGKLNQITTFNVKSNWFFESLINPLLYVAFDLTNKVDVNTEQILCSRFILDLNTQAKKNYFEQNYINRFDIDYHTFLYDLINNNISYTLDEDVIQVPPRVKRFRGTFSVIRVTNTQTSLLNSEIVSQSNQKLYKLDKLTYTDSFANFEDTQQLKIGDFLEVVSDHIDTKYKITYIDSSTNTIGLELAEGTRGIGIGTDVLKISTSADNTVRADIPVGFNEYCVVFIKSVDPDSRILANNWSAGSAFFTNSLTLGNDLEQESLAQYYQRNVVDFGKYLLSMAEDKMPSTMEGIIPNAPVIYNENFKVSLINQQLTNSNIVVEIKDLISQKNNIADQLKQIDDSISRLRIKIGTTIYGTQIEKDSDKKQLDNFITDRKLQTELYSSIVKEIETKSKTEAALTAKPKFRVRGFWEMPVEKVAPSTGKQAIIKFKIRYRYLSQNGTLNQLDQINIQNSSDSTIGVFSNYETIETALRTRSKNRFGKWEWDNISINDPEQININQLEIPISKGEIVEFQIKSVSEAGWPHSPLMSEWSNAVRVEFPQDLSEAGISALLEQNRQDIAKVSLIEAYNAKGLDEHLISSFRANERYFAHSALDIASGFVSENQTPIDLFTKIQELQSKIGTLQAEIKGTRGELNVTLRDDKGATLNLNKNTKTKIFAGYYTNEIKDLSIKKGVIVSKSFFINISNSNDGVLRLISRCVGSRDSIVGKNITDTTDSEFTNYLKYDIAPVVITNDAPKHASQTKNQFIYFRGKDISGDQFLYEDAENVQFSSGIVADENGFLLTEDNANGIWNGTEAPGLAKHVRLKGSQHIYTVPDTIGKNTTQARFEYTNLADTINSFMTDHQYLVGTQSCGSFLFPNLNDISIIQVDGDSLYSNKTIGSGLGQSINIPITFQYRMTDYWGDGDTGIGRIGGSAIQDESLTYSKKIGIDIWLNRQECVQYDIEIEAKYKPDGLTIDSFPQANITTAINSLNKVLNKIN